VLNIRGCPICGSFDFKEIIFVAQAPKFHVISAGTELSSHLFGEVRLVECILCKHLFNNAIQDNEKNPGHGSFLTNAPVSQSMFARRRETLEFLLADDDNSMDVLEVGAGSGALAAIFAESNNKVTIVEPESIIDLERLNKLGVRVIRDNWPTNQLVDEKFDLILCVQVLEHIARPREFLLEIAKHLRDSGKIYMEVPSGDFVKKHGSVADINYPHWNLFTESIVQRLVTECDLNISRSRELISGHDIGYVLQNPMYQSDYSVKDPFQNFENAKLKKSLKYAQQKITKFKTK
jgi:SAM-dependent methyltransferase